MKKFSPSIFWFLGGILITATFFCVGKEKGQPKQTPASEASIEFAPMDKEAFEKLTGDFKGYAKEYDDMRKKPGNIKKKHLTQYIWYDLEQFTDSLNTLKGKGANGVRIYFGVYPKDTRGGDEHGNPSEVGERMTLFFVGTAETTLAGSKIHRDIIDSAKGVLAAFKSFNEGGLCPPPDANCNGRGAYYIDQLQ